MKPLPKNYEAEHSVLAAMIIDREAIPKILDILLPDGSDFDHPAHKKIYEKIITFVGRNIPVDIILLTDTFKDSDYLDSVGGVSYLNYICEALPTTANIEYYARLVKDKAIRRKIISLSSDLITEAYEDNTLEEIIDLAQKKFIALDSVGRKQSYYDIQCLLKKGYEELEALKQSGQVSGLLTGFSSVDFILGGLQKSDLVLIAGRPSMGKSSFCCQMATNIALAGKKVGYFSIETGQRQVIKNILATQSIIETTKFRDASFTDHEWDKITKTISAMYETTFFLDDQIRTSADIVRQSRRMYAEKGLDIIFVDHVQEIHEGGKYENRNAEIGNIVSNLKRLGRDLDIPVVSVAQLSRKVEDRGGDCRPKLSDLRDSGSLEEKADIIMFVYRDEYYKKEKSEKQNIAEIIIDKHRNGATATAELFWNKKFVRFDALDYGDGR